MLSIAQNTREGDACRQPKVTGQLSRWTASMLDRLANRRLMIRPSGHRGQNKTCKGSAENVDVWTLAGPGLSRMPRSLRAQVVEISAGSGMFPQFFNTDSRQWRHVGGPDCTTDAGQQESGFNHLKGERRGHTRAAPVVVDDRMIALSAR